MRSKFVWSFAIVVCVVAGLARAQVLEQVTDTKLNDVIYRPSIVADGSTVWQITTGDPFGQNPLQAMQIEIRDTAGGSGSPFLSLPEGVVAVSVSDDGLKVAFVSYADPVGQNADGSAEVFFSLSDGSGIVQLTDFATPPFEPIEGVFLSGSGNRILFSGPVDPLSGNPDNDRRLFVVDADGANLLDLAAMPPTGLVRMSASDDGSRIVFADNQDPTGQNADGSFEVFAIEHDGSNLRQLTNASTYASDAPKISGDGSTIVFTSREDMTGGNPTNTTKIFRIDWDGTNLTQIFGDSSSRFSPSISDDAQTLSYSGSRQDPVENPNGIRQFWTSSIDGTGEATLTSFTENHFSQWSALSGDGTTLTWIQFGGDLGSNPDEGYEVYSVRSGGPVTQLTELPRGPDDCFEFTPDGPAITPDGSRVVYACNNDIYRIQSDGTDRVQVTTIGDSGLGEALAPDISADGNTIVFSDTSLLFLSESVYAVDADGNNLRRLNPDPLPGNRDHSTHPVISDDGSKIVFQACYGFQGYPFSFGCDLWSIDPDGSNLTKMTSIDTVGWALPRIDGTGTWATYQYEGVFRVRTDGTVHEAVSSGEALTPDIDASGNRIVYGSFTDPLGQNPDGNVEVFLRDYAAGTTTQLTDTVEGDNWGPRISRDGNYVTFFSTTPYFEAKPGQTGDGYRLEIASGKLERVGGLRRGTSSLRGTDWEARRFMDMDETGRRVLYGADGDFAGFNGDFKGEHWIADFGTPNTISVSKTAPTVVSWRPSPTAIRFDAIRGNVAELAANGANVDLGNVICLQDSSPKVNTEAAGDVEPPQGTVFFYLFRGTQGVDDGPGSYGTGSDGSERLAGGGDCNP
ncbi:hypothetical protein ABI59_19775 [Acidobacteria bacterium Mor1]|nr:hypothetical protein ABI59_19775 [Acidobacteria bacterium Mor1]